MQEDEESFIGLYRSDGTALVTYPEVDATAGKATTHALTDALEHDELAGKLITGRSFDKDQRLLIFRRVGQYHLFVTAGFLLNQLFIAWLHHFFLICALAGLPCSAIWALLGFSLRQLAAEERGWKKWREETLRRRDAEASGRHLQRMGALGNLVANVAHEFNNHLMAVNSNVTIARKKRYTDVEDQVLAVERATHNVAGLVRTLMGVTRKQPVKPAEVDLFEAIPKLRPVVRAAVGDAISIGFDVSPDLWPVTVDLAEFELAIINLALNARDAMPRGGKFTLSAENVKSESLLGGVQAGDFVLVTASDDGVGMAPSVAERAFEPLFTTKRQGTAAGLGLAQVLAFCELSGGTAKITTTLEVGTAVRLYLPRCVSREQRPTGQGKVHTTPTDSATTSVLLVEDNHEVAAGLAAVLRLMGHDVVHLDNADNALLALEGGQRFSLVLSDVQMPGKLNGIDLVDWLKTHCPGQAVALMTGYADELERARGTGVPIFAKPFDPQELTTLIQ
ncbi:response regulator [Paraburkholderia bryophila]|uniref:histidine kinase n=1 Tax=Paraburkholderia bryophila TaxID=420952 RepID=A0A329CDX2_9BURK|nr:signal transduction histidine kinase [Paraburkholderia bryophila]